MEFYKTKELQNIIDRNNFEDAREALKELSFSNYPDQSILFTGCGNLYILKKDYVSAIKAYRTAISFNPVNVSAHFKLGRLYMSRRNYQKTKLHFEKILEIQPDEERVEKLLKEVIDIEKRLLDKTNVRNHVVITGTGRAGTTLLVKILTKLGLDTGFDSSKLENHVDKLARAGLEQNLLSDPHCSYVVKSPAVCNQIDEIIKRGNIILDHAIIPIRDMESAALSRIKVFNDSGNKEFIAGGIWETSNPDDQETVLRNKLIKLLIGLSKLETPVTFIHYPKFTKEPKYLFKKLKSIFPDIGEKNFLGIYHDTVDRKLVSKLK